LVAKESSLTSISLKVFNDYKRRNQGNVGEINGFRLFFGKIEMDFRQEMA